MDKEQQQYKLIHPLKHFRNLLDHQVREDGREFDKYRPIAVSHGIFKNCNGSSAVKFGNTNIVCGIRAEVGKPNMQTPNKGYIVPNIDMSFVMNSATNTDESDVLNCLLYDTIIDSNMIELTDLCILPKKLVWILYIDIICLEQDGGVLDAIVLACVTALTNVQLPKISMAELSGEVTVETETLYPLRINSTPVLSTCCKFNNLLLIDPTKDEEQMTFSKATIGIENGKVVMYKTGGEAVMQMSDLNKMLEGGIKKEKELYELMKTVNKS